ncbi:hypothetical protein K5I29_06935 [Flavobacterium agricola]|uniref:DUF4468 domain-containing protein n=1 Tax=Flavobacterium agricola TaxID=2870839 RepID=A0ABY6LXP4_9FLAO|nr:hypothetical protein [Flavobacterium agricola]UYW00312.1 hypothetical protein K5I29_06935 [Flavobacterium agricola]
MTNGQVIFGIGALLCFSNCSQQADAISLQENYLDSLNLVEQTASVFKEVSGTYVGIVKSGAEDHYNSVQMTLFPDYTFQVVKQNIKGDRKITKIKGTYTVVDDTLTLYHVIYHRKYLLKNKEIHYMLDYNPTDMNFVEKCMQNILYKIN